MYTSRRAQKLYLAAVAVAEGFESWSCNAIKAVGSRGTAEAYNAAFRPDGINPLRTAWGIDWADTRAQADNHDVALRDVRTLALLFAAAMAETGDL